MPLEIVLHASRNLLAVEARPWPPRSSPPPPAAILDVRWRSIRSLIHSQMSAMQAFLSSRYWKDSKAVNKSEINESATVGWVPFIRTLEWYIQRPIKSPSIKAASLFQHRKYSDWKPKLLFARQVAPSHLCHFSAELAEIWSRGTFCADIWTHKISALYLLYFQSY